jgi:hypothetical protein
LPQNEQALVDAEPAPTSVSAAAAAASATITIAPPPHRLRVDLCCVSMLALRFDCGSCLETD